MRTCSNCIPRFPSVGRAHDASTFSNSDGGGSEITHGVKMLRVVWASLVEPGRSAIRCLEDSASFADNEADSRRTEANSLNPHVNRGKQVEPCLALVRRFVDAVPVSNCTSGFQTEMSERESPGSILVRLEGD